MRVEVEKAEMLAQKFRADCGLGYAVAVNVKSLLRKLNVLTLYKPLSEHACGLSLKSVKGEMFMLINSNNSRGRQHFTIAHEFYHLFYDEYPTPHVCSKDGLSKTERLANLFASALLMPQSGVLAMLQTKDVSGKDLGIEKVLRMEQYFGVSRTTMLLRLKDLGVINEKSYRKLKSMPIIQSAKDYGYDLSLYKPGNEGLVIGDYGEKARLLFESGRISEGHYNELIDRLNNE